MNMLPGWHPGAFVGGSQRPISVAFVASSVSVDSNTITSPAGIQAGDLLIISHHCTAGNTTIPPDVTPAGFTLANTSGDNDGGDNVAARVSTHWKKAVGTESSTAFNVMNSTGASRAVFLVFRATPVAGVISIFDTDGLYDFTTVPPNQTILSGAGVIPLLVYGVAYLFDDYDGDNLNGTTLNPAADATVANGAATDDEAIKAMYKIYNASPVNVVLQDDGSAGGAFGVQSMFFEFS